MSDLISCTSGMTDQVAVVTGAARGIGAATCRTLADAGVDVVAADLLDCSETAMAVRERGRRGLALKLDVADRDAVKRAVDGIVEDFGRLDILVCNAGICPAGDMVADPEQWDRVLRVNLDGAFNCIAGAWPHMRARRYGKIVTVSSMAAHRGGVIVGPEYSASKGAIVSMTHHAARNGGPYNIYCNCVSPGIIDTDMTAGFAKPDLAGIPLGREGKAEDVAEPIRFLCSPASNYITGIVSPIAGGLFFNG